ncbi:hypothetical protein HMPREF0580_1956 [Mobiluncus mulieris ATCC 35239]|uniref:Uncharacterized protein n=1 Tax=Mobiluncus mulieris ATCC 35239 TaxID=871571 RepID=E0QSU1_9ACTO|nr:daptide-type RiPP [Mobiluncus mulieris]EEJ53719.1 hypothetical protein HMPREF0577_1313 [Mobiluncus mulieris ATCC 35243]EFM45373.1 hypothetical protein HMPREF0580_1956 [Mobiluncus mulieris ATCC 35239]SPX71038.1 Uncharacterised protein [Mobiluncus mulieris]
METKYDFMVEPLEGLVAPFDWSDFGTGMGVGVGLAAIVVMAT